MAPTPVQVVRFIGRSSRRIAVSIAGGAVVLAGLAMLVLPGPGIVVVVLGFAILGTEYAWAATVLERSRDAAGKAGRVAKDNLGRAGGSAKRGVGRAARAVTGKPAPREPREGS